MLKILLNIWPNSIILYADSLVYIIGGPAYSTNGLVGCFSSGVLRRSIIAAIIIVISYISANRLECCSIVIRTLGAGAGGNSILVTGVGTGSNNSLVGDIIFRSLFLRFGSAISSRIAYIFSYTLIFRGIGASEYRV